MADVVMVIAPKVFRDEEYSKPRDVLIRRGASVTTASLSAGTCIGKLGMEANAEISLAQAVDRSWDAVIFVGGGGAEVYFDDPNAHRLALEAAANGAVLGAICIAPSILAHAGLLDGVKATAFPSQQDDLISHGARWLSDPVVVDGRFVTANGPESADGFGEAVADALGL